MNIHVWNTERDVGQLRLESDRDPKQDGGATWSSMPSPGSRISFERRAFESV